MKSHPEKTIQQKEKFKMSTKFVRFVAVLAILVSIAGNSGVGRADGGAPPSVSAQNLQPPPAPEAQPLNITPLNIPPASSLGVQFVHVATAANSSVDYTIIDHPLTNGNPNAIILVTPNWNPGGVGGTYDNHPIGVWYNGSKWAIFNQDGVTAIPVGAAFNVIIPTAGAGVFVHTATVGNRAGDYTMITNSLTDGNPNAIVAVTPNWNPGGGGSGTYNNHPTGVFYDGSKWAIFNQDGTTAIPVNASFNVSVLTAGAGVFIHTATVGNNAGDYTKIDNPLTNNHPNAIVFVTPNWDPGGGVSGTYNNHPIGVFYGATAGQWTIFNQDLAPIPLGAAFNVLVLVPASDIFVHTATAGNSVGAYTNIDNRLTNFHPNAVVFTTPNWNPGGVGGMYNNHNIGVYYDGIQWTIFNQDNVTMPANAAFNVLVPNPDTSVFVHKATAANSAGDYTTIDYPLTNGKPNAIILVTLNYDPGGTCVCAVNDHPIGVYYDGGNSKWAIFNQDHAAIPVGATFNVFVPTAGPGVGVFVHTATGGSGNQTYINNPMTNGNPNAIVVVTPNWNPGGIGGVYANFPIGVYYNNTARKWAIFNQNGISSSMPANAAFNVYVVGSKLYLPLVIR